MGSTHCHPCIKPSQWRSCWRRWSSRSGFVSSSTRSCTTSTSCKTSKCGHFSVQDGGRGGGGTRGGRHPYPTTQPTQPCTVPNHQDSSKEDNRHHHPRHHHHHQCEVEAEAQQGQQDDAEVLRSAPPAETAQYGPDWAELCVVQHEGDGGLQELRRLLPRRLHQRHQALRHLPYQMNKPTNTHVAATEPPLACFHQK